MATSHGKSPVVAVQPPTIHLPPPHDRVVRNTLIVSNNGHDRLAVKVRASAPQRYHVKPKLFVLNAGQSIPVVITMTAPAEPVSNGKRDMFLLDCRPFPPGRAEPLDQVFPTLGAPIEQLTIHTDGTTPLASLPASANVTFPPAAEGTSEAPTRASSAQPHAPSAATHGLLKTDAAMASAAAELRTAKQRLQAAKAAQDEVQDASTVLEAQREELLGEIRAGAAAPSVRLSFVVFLMLASYAAGLLLSRGWPTMPPEAAAA